ncbi:hypothetical protein DFH06DRAFT_1152384 [Mycena polygramma]|nr:hypothetical protein DFH06DRAFT_1152384 [Mycena polygramma]
MAVAKKRVPEARKAPVRRRSRKHEGKTRGKLPWIHGTKLAFFEGRRAAWAAAKEQGSTALSTFYMDVRNLYLLKYGYKMGDNEDLETDVEDPTNPNARDPTAEGLSEEEAAERSAYAEAVKKRIAAWYCRTSKEVSANQRDLFAQALGAFSSEGPPYPTRAQPLHYFSRHFYEEKIKARFEADFKVETQRAKDLGEDIPHEIKIRNQATKDVFLEQTEEFQHKIMLGVEAQPLEPGS